MNYSASFLISVFALNYRVPSIESDKNDKNDKNNIKVDFKPVTKADMNIVHITNAGFEMKKSVDLERYEYYDNFINKARNLTEANRDEPKKSVIDQFCDDWDDTNSEERDQVEI